MKIKKYIADIVENGKSEDMKKLSEMLEEVVCKMKEYHPEEYKHYKMCLYEMAYGKKLNMEIADEWVKSMEPMGKHWTMEATTEAMKDKGYECDPTEFYIIANMMYNDYYNIVKDNETLALQLAYDWIKDEDAKKDKVYEYWKYIIKRD